MNNRNQDISLELLEVLRKIYFGKSSRELAEFLQGEMRVLSYLCTSAQCDVQPGEIAAALDMTGGRIAGILRTLEKKGYIERTRSPGDRRNVLVNPTPSGLTHITQKTNYLLNVLSSVIYEISEKEALQLIASLSLWYTAYDKIADSGCAFDQNQNKDKE